MKVGDIVLAGNSTFRIMGVYLGGVGTQNIVGLKSIHKADGGAQGRTIVEMFVPEELVLCAEVYRRVDGGGYADVAFHPACGAYHNQGQCPSGSEIH
jgi:hypothetical protein